MQAYKGNVSWGGRQVWRSGRRARRRTRRPRSPWRWPPAILTASPCRLTAALAQRARLGPLFSASTASTRQSGQGASTSSLEIQKALSCAPVVVRHSMPCSTSPIATVCTMPQPPGLSHHGQAFTLSARLRSCCRARTSTLSRSHWWRRASLIGARRYVVSSHYEGGWNRTGACMSTCRLLAA